MPYIFLVLASCFFTTRQGFAQISAHDFRNVRWKVNEMYVNHARIESPKIDSLRFYFSGNGMLRLGMKPGNNGPSVHYAYNPQDSLISFDEAMFSAIRYKVIYVDDHNLVMTQLPPPGQQEVTHLEYRLVPDK